MQKVKYIFILTLLMLPLLTKAQELQSIINVIITEENGKNPIPVRVKIKDSDANVTKLPKEAISIMYGTDDRAQGYGFQPDESFYVDGEFSLDLEAGKYQMHFSKGVEYVDQTEAQLTIDFELKIEKGTWIAARCYAGPNQVAHTTPVYITINNKEFYNEETLQENLTLNEKYLDELEKELEESSDKMLERAWWYKKGLFIPES